MDYSIRFKNCIDFVIDQEIIKTSHGVISLANVENDRGGLTNWGIALKDHPELGESYVKTMTRDEAIAIYYPEYWIKIQGDNLGSSGLALAVLDFAVNSGVHRATVYLQNLIGIKSDGLMGIKTCLASKVVDQKLTVLNYCESRRQFIEKAAKVPGQEKFLATWLRRVNAVEAAALGFLSSEGV